MRNQLNEARRWMRCKRLALLVTGMLFVAIPAHSSPNEDLAESGTLFLDGDESQPAQAALLLSTQVDMAVSGLVARVAVRQTFKNTSADWVHGTYVFPLPETAAVDRLSMQIGERIIEGQIKPREVAKKIYRKAKTSGKRATLVEQQRPNMFTNRVANIGPGETIVVAIEYQETVAYKGGEFSLRFPLTTGIRYIPGQPAITGFDGGGWAFNTDQVPDASTITPPVTELGEGSDNPVSISVDLNPGFELDSIVSPYHAISRSDLGASRYRIVLDGGAVPANRDFELIWQPVASQAPRAALFTQEKGEEHYALLMMLPPELEWAKQQALAREVIYVIDTSGSMHGASIDQARQALLYALKRLRAEDTFNIVEFNSTTRAFSSGAVAVTPANLNRAAAWVKHLRADGGTEMAGALNAVLDGREQTERLRQVIFMTDGSVGNEQALFDLIGQKLGGTRLFTVGIGSAPNSYFMREAAATGRGTFTYIGAVSEIKTRMRDLLNQLEFPVLSDLQITNTSGQEFDYSPDPLPDLYVNEPLVVSLRLPERAIQLEVSGRLAGKPWSSALSVGENGSGATASGLDVLWARNKIASLNRSRSRGVDVDKIRKEITALGLAHHLVTAHTSLVAVDVTPARPLDAASQDHHVANKKPHGWDMQSPNMRVPGQLPQTASALALHGWAAFLSALLAAGLHLLSRRRDGSMRKALFQVCRRAR